MYDNKYIHVVGAVELSILPCFPCVVVSEVAAAIFHLIYSPLPRLREVNLLR